MKWIFVFIFLILLNPLRISAGIKISELYPAPSQDEFEWIELYNDSEMEQMIDHLFFSDAKQNKIPVQNGKILPLEYITATFSGILNNTGGDSVLITDSSGNTIDSVTYSADFQPGSSYARCLIEGAESWVKTQLISKQSSNTQACATPTATPTPTASATPAPSATGVKTPTPSPTPTQSPRSKYGKIFINEIVSNPAEGENEWIEIYNDNDFSVDLTDWKIDDLESGGSKPVSFSTSVEKKSLITVDLPTSMFNNSGDKARLLDYEGKIIDTVDFSGSKIGTSWNRINFNTQEACLEAPSPKKVNRPCAQQEIPAIDNSMEPSNNNNDYKHISATSPYKIIEKDIIPEAKTIIITPPGWYFKVYEDGIDYPTPAASASGQVLGASHKTTPYPIYLPLISSVSSILTIAVTFYKMNQNVQ